MINYKDFLAIWVFELGRKGGSNFVISVNPIVLKGLRFNGWRYEKYAYSNTSLKVWLMVETAAEVLFFEFLHVLTENSSCIVYYALPRNPCYN